MGEIRFFKGLLGNKKIGFIVIGALMKMTNLVWYRVDHYNGINLVDKGLFHKILRHVKEIKKWVKTMKKLYKIIPQGHSEPLKNVFLLDYLKTLNNEFTSYI